MNSTEGGDVPKARLCIIKKWPDFNGYGFNLHAEKGKAGQFIGKVDENSPSEAAGLLEADRIIEINGTNIANENHQQVVQRIKAVANETRLLVVDAKADNYFKENKILLRGDMSEYVVLNECPDTSSSAKTNSIPEEKDVINNNIHDEDSPDEVGPSLRLCHIKIWPDFAGYGFNLHAEKGKPGQFIGKVDDGSPADAAGLRQNDRIVEVNGENLSQATHQEVVEKIKTNATSTKLLVMDAEAETYYKDKNIPVTGTMSNVIVLTCPDARPAANGSTVQAEVTDDRWSGEETPSAPEEVVEVVDEEETQRVSAVDSVDSVHSDEVDQEVRDVAEDVTRVAAVSDNMDEVNNEGEKALADLDNSLRYAEDQPADLGDYDTVQTPPPVEAYGVQDEEVTVVEIKKDEDITVVNGRQDSREEEDEVVTVTSAVTEDDSDRDGGLGKVAVTGTAVVVVTSKDRDDEEARDEEENYATVQKDSRVEVVETTVVVTSTDTKVVVTEEVNYDDVRADTPQVNYDDVRVETPPAATASTVATAATVVTVAETSKTSDSYRDSQLYDMPAEPEDTPSAKETKQATPPTPSTPESPPTSPINKGPVTIAGIEFAGSVAEAREKIRGRKKQDARISANVPAKTKKELFEAM